MASDRVGAIAAAETSEDKPGPLLTSAVGRGLSWAAGETTGHLFLSGADTSLLRRRSMLGELDECLDPCQLEVSTVVQL